MTRVLATYNLKGGVGKTATAVNVAALAARDGLRTLLWDLDPQGAATFTLRVRPKLPGGARKLVRGTRDPAAAVRATDTENLDLLPADFRLRKLDVALAAQGALSLGDVLGPLAERYDLVVLDCPPSISHASEHVFRLADTLLVPLVPTTLSVRTLDQLHDFVRGRRTGPLQVLPFFTLVDRRKRLHASIMAELPARFPGFLTTRVPVAADVERMGVERAPVMDFAPRSAGARAYRALWEEVRPKLGLD